ncbi:unnamed protein product, partial [marine sediment metagenome]
MSNEDVANWWDDVARHLDIFSGAVQGLSWDELWQEARIQVIRLLLRGHSLMFSRIKHLFALLESI